MFVIGFQFVRSFEMKNWILLLHGLLLPNLCESLSALKVIVETRKMATIVNYRDYIFFLKIDATIY